MFRPVCTMSQARHCLLSVGLDMIAIPGKTPASTISGIIVDEAAIDMINQKTTAVRIIPVEGKDVGDSVEFGGLLDQQQVQQYGQDLFRSCIFFIGMSSNKVNFAMLPYCACLMFSGGGWMLIKT